MVMAAQRHAYNLFCLNITGIRNGKKYDLLKMYHMHPKKPCFQNKQQPHNPRD